MDACDHHHTPESFSITTVNRSANEYSLQFVSVAGARKYFHSTEKSLTLFYMGEGKTFYLNLSKAMACADFYVIDI